MTIDMRYKKMALDMTDRLVNSFEHRMW